MARGGVGFKQTLPPGNSYSNCFSSPFDSHVDRTATIEIGSRLNMKVQARTYVEKDPAAPLAAPGAGLPLVLTTPAAPRPGVQRAPDDDACPPSTSG